PDRCLLFVRAEDGIRVFHVTGVQTCALPIFLNSNTTNSRRLRTSRTDSSVTSPGTTTTSKATPLPLGRFPPRNRESRTKAASPCPLVCFPAPRGESSVKLAPVFETSSFFRSDLNEESVRQRHSFPARNSNAGPGSGVSTKDAARDHH